MKAFLFTDGMILYTENSKEPTDNFLELRNEFSKVAAYKIMYKN